MSEYHTPVMLKESIDGLSIREDGTYVDVTFGGGGHSREILSRLGRRGRLFALDKDGDANAAIDDGRFTFIRSDFRFLSNWMHYYGVEEIDGLIADLGVSSHQLDDAARGFTLREDTLLDMRMNALSRLTATTVVNDYKETALAKVLYLYGELKDSRRLAAAIVKERSVKPIRTTGQLCAILEPMLPRERVKKDMARVFQALRIEVNGEMDALQQLLVTADDLLAGGGRIAVISYHSLEDRIVKNAFRENDDLKSVCKLITPSKQEISTNPRSRSAKLRIAQKKEQKYG